jgi:hypothetical protein
MRVLALPQVDGHLSKAEELMDAYNPAWSLCPGSMGIWPDPYYLDRKSRKLAGKEFSVRYVHQQPLKHRVLFVRGAHEDHFWLRRRKEIGAGLELLPNLTWLADGYKTVLHNELRVTGLGGVYSPRYYDSNEGFKTKLRAYRRRQVEKACSSGKTDILLIHESPHCPGIDQIVFATRPQLIIHHSPVPVEQTVADW